MQSQRNGGRLFALVAIAGCIAFALTACGRKTQLDPPPTAAAPSPSATGQTQPPPDWRAPPAEETATPAQRNRRFILDPLLD